MAHSEGGKCQCAIYPHKFRTLQKASGLSTPGLCHARYGVGRDAAKGGGRERRELQRGDCPGSSASRTPTGAVPVLVAVGPGVAEGGDREQTAAARRLSRFVRFANSHRGSAIVGCCGTGCSRRRRPGTLRAAAWRLSRFVRFANSHRGSASVGCCGTGCSRRRRPGTQGRCGAAAVQVRPLRERPQGVMPALRGLVHQRPGQGRAPCDGLARPVAQHGIHVPRRKA